MSISVGDKIPSINFKQLGDDGLKDVVAEEYCKGRKVVIFAVPGAFTPTCSAQHLPSFQNNAEALRSKGVDAIACVSVNDAFVMQAWGQSQNVGDDIDLLADGNGDFARATGLTLDGTGFGLGERTTRFSMLIEDGVVTQLNVEENPGELNVSSAEHLIANL
ncbi:MAG: peroxiredoxin [Rhodospirillaceae bacterium]|nr:peroxiredoxin [Alphaproteobacteria bacterium]MBR73012.1 peroxiredoxin [Rhodospirillaceae bacterium]|tara:strand:- start:57 stop:542 length:486 start_codon:yes stop_codon:yes gene_type:complete